MIKKYQMDTGKGGLVTIGLIEKSLNNALKEYEDKSITLIVSKKIKKLMDMNIGYDHIGLGVDIIGVDISFKDNEFELEIKEIQ